MKSVLVLLLSHWLVLSAHASSIDAMAKAVISHGGVISHGVIKSEGRKLALEQIASGLGVPWGLTFISDTRLLITERDGRLLQLDILSGDILEIKGVPDVLSEGQGGLLDVAVSPHYKQSGWIYFTYAKPVKGMGATVLARAKLRPPAVTDWQDLLISRSLSGNDIHYGSRIAFHNEHVFFSIGDRGDRDNAQDITNHAGSILRLKLDGSVPEDNPGNHPQHMKKKFLAEVWSTGHRNPQGLAYDTDRNILWSIEHGPRGGDEINAIVAGANYGWPVISYGKEYWGPVAVGEGTHRDGMEQPVKVFTPSIAPGSLVYYNHKAIPQWHSSLFSGALKLRHLNRIVLSKQGKVIKEERLLKSLNERIRALAISSQGELYFSTDSGKIFRLRAHDD